MEDVDEASKVVPGKPFSMRKPSRAARLRLLLASIALLLAANLGVGVAQLLNMRDLTRAAYYDAPADDITASNDSETMKSIDQHLAAIEQSSQSINEKIVKPEYSYRGY